MKRVRKAPPKVPPNPQNGVSLEKREHVAATILFLLLFAVVLFRSAWVSEDAYITFWTVDNFIRGYGLTWNIVERVQAFTNPLWMFLMAAFYFVTGEIFYTSMFISIVLSLATIYLLASRIARSPVHALLAITVLTFSKAFVDYSTSGLENPLTHLILAVFLFVYLKYKITRKTLFILSLVAAMGVLNRIDTIVLFLPALAYFFVKLGKWKEGTYAILLGFLPFIIWECFSLLYYGFPFPNTAYAKLNTGISQVKLVRQGFSYLENSIKIDPLTLLVIASGLAIPFLKKDWRKLPVDLGIASYLIYVVIVGGDFMSGRFLAAPLLGVVILLSDWDLGSHKVGYVALVLVILAGLASPYSPVFSGANYGLKREGLIDGKGISDERGFYYPYASFLRALKLGPYVNLPNYPWVAQGQRARAYAEARGPIVVVMGNVGLFGFYAGPYVHIVDSLALADPLLARLPAKENSRIGHFERIVPEGYVETLASGQNVIRDKELAAYYDKLSLITRGNLLDPKRLVEIWNMNLGKYDGLIN